MPKTVVMTGLSERAIDEVMTLHDQNNGVTPMMVLEAAADATSALHEYFEWDDALAGASYRLGQARQLIARIRIYVEDRPEIKVRALINVEDGYQRRYVHVSQLNADEMLHEQARRQIMRQLQQLMGKLRMFDEFASIATAIDEALNGTSPP